MFLTQKEASGKLCPFKVGGDSTHCCTEGCMAWQWQRVTAKIQPTPLKESFKPATPFTEASELGFCARLVVPVPAKR